MLLGNVSICFLIHMFGKCFEHCRWGSLLKNVFGILKNIQDTWLACHFVKQTFMNPQTAQDKVAIIITICVWKLVNTRQWLVMKIRAVRNVYNLYSKMKISIKNSMTHVFNSAKQTRRMNQLHLDASLTKMKEI